MGYRIRVEQDQDCESPNEYSIGKVVSFSTRHSDFQHPDTIDEGDILTLLSYSEHGRHQWRVAGDARPLGIDQWDDVGVAGVIVWNGEDDGRKWWDDRPDDEKAEALRSIAEEYTAWGNGDCFGYILERSTECASCGNVEWEDVDSCWGFIVADLDVKKAMREWWGVDLPTDTTWDDVEIVYPW